MPYITQDKRDILDPTINQLIELLKKEDVTNVDGDLNYVITRLLKSLYPPKYYNFNRCLGVLSCVQQEFYRKSVAPYEEIKEKDNGTVK